MCNLEAIKCTLKCIVGVPQQPRFSLEHAGGTPANYHEPIHIATHQESLANLGARLSRRISRPKKYHLFVKQEPRGYRVEKAGVLGDVKELGKVQMAIECFLK